MRKRILFSNEVDWRYICWQKPIESKTIDYYKKIPYKGNFLLKKFLRVFYSTKLNTYFKMPFKFVFYKGIIQALDIKKDDELDIIIYDRTKISCDLKFVDYIKKNYPKARIGYLFSDIVSRSGANRYKIVDKLSLHYDKIFSFDKKDSIDYNFDYSYLIFDRDTNSSDTKCKSDVFLVAKAKDRLKEILDAYDMCVENKVIVDFTVNCIPDEDIHFVENRRITTNEVLPYLEVIDRLNSSKSICDIMQHGSTGITLNVIEAIVYNKKIISNNISLMKEPFYDKSRFFILGRDSDLNTFLNTKMKDYTEKDKEAFSGLYLFSRLRN